MRTSLSCCSGRGWELGTSLVNGPAPVTRSTCVLGSENRTETAQQENAGHTRVLRRVCCIASDIDERTIGTHPTTMVTSFKDTRARARCGAVRRSTADSATIKGPVILYCIVVIENFFRLYSIY